MDVRMRPLTKQETLSRSSEWFLSGGEGEYRPRCLAWPHFPKCSHTGRSSQVSRQHTLSPGVCRHPHSQTTPYSNKRNKPLSHSTCSMYPQPTDIRLTLVLLPAKQALGDFGKQTPCRVGGCQIWNGHTAADREPIRGIALGRRTTRAER